MVVGEIMGTFMSADNMKMGAIAVCALVVLEILSRKIPNDLIYEYVSKWGILIDGALKIAALCVSAFLLRWLPKKIAERAEEGIISTLCVFIAAFLKPVAEAPKKFVEYLTADNKNIQKQRK